MERSGQTYPPAGNWPTELRNVYETSSESLIRMATGLIGCRADAEEVTHDAFAAASRQPHHIDNPGAYLRRSVINGCYGRLRHRRVVERQRIDPPPPAAPVQLIEFRDVLLSLTTKQRTAIVLRFLENLTVAETAEIMNCPESTVRSHTRRGLKSLRKELGQ